ncbi:MAG: hypothetical protein RIM72_09580 [Alphaproteobacteria bacterium]
MKPYPEYRLFVHHSPPPAVTQRNDPVERNTANIPSPKDTFLGQVLDALMKGLARGMTI